MALATYQDLVTALQSGYQQPFLLSKAPPAASGLFASLWSIAGLPAQGANPTPALQGAACDLTTVGAVPLANATAPKRLFVFLVCAGGGGASYAGEIFLYDRLWHVGGINLNITSTQTFTGVTAPSRHTDGIGNQLLLEITTAPGSTGQTLSVAYTDQNDAAQTATIVVPGSAVANRLDFLALGGDGLGVKSVQSATLGGGMGGSGVANLVMVNVKDLFPVIPYTWNVYTEREMIVQSALLPVVPADACLALMYRGASSSSPLLQGRIVLLEG